MSKQKTIEHTVIHPTIEWLGAVSLTLLGFLVSFEAIVEHHPKLGHGAGHSSEHGVSELVARGEAKGETARLPEEFDVGLQTPHISGI